MKLLIHACCVGCLAGPHKKLLEGGHELSCFFYNPNIQPFEEYRRRLRAVQEYAQRTRIEVIFKDEYPLREFLKGAMAGEGDGKKRCEYCYNLRLSATAKKAKELGCDAFTTTLLISNHQDHGLVKKICEEVAEAEGINFYYEDFRPLCDESHTEVKEMGLYLQNYCGCVFSEEDRFKKELVSV